MVGIKGLTQGPSGRIIDFPMVPSLKEGLSPLEYFISTHGSRKGLTDTALNTAKAGYLTRRLVDVAQDVIVTEEDCGEKEGIRLTKENASGIEISLARNARGRVLAKDAIGADGKAVYKKGELLGRDEASAIDKAGATEVFVRSPLTCKTLRGVCQKCYGMDLGRGVLVALGETVGIVAAQAIGEPGTQLTMRTFHAGGAAGEDITMGLPRVEDIFERQTPKAQAVVCKIDGTVSDIKRGEKDDLIIVVLGDAGGAKKEKKEVEHSVSFRRTPNVKVNQDVKAGDLLTDGYADIEELFRFGGADRAQRYIISEINKIYETQGASIARKHVEVIVQQMFSRRKIKVAGETRFSVGDVVEESEIVEENERVEAEGKEPAKGDSLVLGITEVALTKESFLSAASFQNTSRVLIEAAVGGAVDRLYGLKENVILGRLIPAGTGFPANRVEPAYDDEELEEMAAGGEKEMRQLAP
jgi:DNA-directed RNA polymerase subunit beta'